LCIKMRKHKSHRDPKVIQELKNTLPLIIRTKYPNVICYPCIQNVGTNYNFTKFHWNEVDFDYTEQTDLIKKLHYNLPDNLPEDIYDNLGLDKVPSDLALELAARDCDFPSNISLETLKKYRKQGETVKERMTPRFY